MSLHFLSTSLNLAKNDILSIHQDANWEGLHEGGYLELERKPKVKHVADDALRNRLFKSNSYNASEGYYHLSQ